MTETAAFPLKDLMQGAPHLVAVLTALEDAGHQAFLVGGSVRDAVMGRPAKDLDVATSARPDVVTALFEGLGCAVHPTGIEHGTVTVVMRGEPFEITTFRRDVETDGRRAVVAFAETIDEDAQRRDFTFNALYARRDGAVLDPTGTGLGDAHTRRLRFVGDAEMRIREDALRILRFFRFAAQLDTPVLETEDFFACITHAELLDTLSRERVGAEMLKLLAGPAAADTMAAMTACKIATRVLPLVQASCADVFARLRAVADQEQQLGLNPCALRRLTVLCDAAPKEELKLSNAQEKAVSLRLAASRSTYGPARLGHYFGTEIAEDALILRHAAGTGPSVDGAALDLVLRGAETKAPVSARDLMDRFQGPALGAELKRQTAAHLDQMFGVAG